MTASVASAGRGWRGGAAGRWRFARVIGAIGLLVAVIAVGLPLLTTVLNDLTLPLADQDIIRQQAAEKRLDPALIAAVIYAETKFDSRPSAAGAQGLMQIMPQTAEFLARRSGATTFAVADLGDPEVNIAYGAYYLRYLLDRYGHHLVTALAAYNAGESNVDHWIAAIGRDRLTDSEIPFAETRAYVSRVLAAQREYRRRYASQLGYR